MSGFIVHPSMGTQTRYDVAKMKDDMDLRGWLPTDLAKQSGMSDMTVSRFLNGLRANPRTAARLAEALGYTVRRYLIRSKERNDVLAGSR